MLAPPTLESPMPERRLTRDIMTTDVTTFLPGSDLIQAAQILFDHHWAGAPVVDGGQVVGVVTLADVVAGKKDPHPPKVFVLFDALLYLGSRRKFEEELRKISAMTVGDAMSSPPITVTSDTTVADVSALMVDQRLSTIPVVDDGELVGVVGRRDVVRLILGAAREGSE
jgi:CBS domain-containing protein